MFIVFVALVACFVVAVVLEAIMGFQWTAPANVAQKKPNPTAAPLSQAARRDTFVTPSQAAIVAVRPLATATAPRDTTKYKDYVKEIRAMVIGSEKCGRSQLVNRYCYNVFPPPTTDGAMILPSDDYKIDRHGIKIIIRDLTSNRHLQEHTRSYYRLTVPHACMICVDPTDQGESLRDAKKRLWPNVKRYCTLSTCKTAVIITKMDLVSDAETRELVAEIVRWASILRAPIFYTSAKVNRNVSEAFEALFAAVVDHVARNGQRYATIE